MTDYVWSGKTGNWQDAGNWTPAGVPSGGYPYVTEDTATVGGDGSYVVQGYGSAVGLTLNDPNATLDMQQLNIYGLYYGAASGTFALDAGVIAGGTIILNDAVLSVAPGETLSGAEYELSTFSPKWPASEIQGTDLVIGAGASVTGRGAVEAQTVTNYGTIDALGPISDGMEDFFIGLAIRTPLFTNDGLVVDRGNDPLGNEIVNNGLIQFLETPDYGVSPSIGILTNNGTIAIADSATLALSAGSLGSITFADLVSGTSAPGTLDVEWPGLTTATIGQFDAGDVIQFSTSGTDGLNYADHLLTLTIDGTIIAELTMTGSYQQSDFHLSHGMLTTDVTCFVRGTRILTESGEIAVEALRIGDRVVTASGAMRAVKWIGHRAYDGRFIAGDRNVLPVRIRAGALDENVPHRDLLVSPHHAMLLDGVLIPAEHLLNGASILQEEAVESVAYFHIELDSHDVLIAEGAAAESFVDCDSRALFQNAAEFRALYPDAEPPRWRFCAERVEGGAVLERVWRRLAERAGVVTTQPGGALRGQLDTVSRGTVSGWAADDKGVPLELVVLVDGAIVGRVRAAEHRADLDAAGIGDGRHGFHVALPRLLGADAPHLVAVRRESDGAELPGSPVLLAALPRRLPAGATVDAVLAQAERLRGIGQMRRTARA